MTKNRLLLRLLISPVFIVGSALPVQSLLAIDVGYDGYFRSRGNYFYDLQMDRGKTPKVRAFTDFRFRLNPSFYISDKIRVKSSLNFIDGVLGDNPFRSGPYNNPAQSYNKNLDPNEQEAVIGRTTGSTVTPYGGAYLPDGQVTSADLKPIQLRRLWGEFDFPYGTLKIGRMPNDFGMGIFANAGDLPTQEVGSSRDRIMLDTSFGPYYVRPGAGWLLEGSLDQSADDFYEYFLIFGRKQERTDVGLYISYNGQDAYQPTPDTKASPSFVNAETAFWAIDFYFQNDFDLVNLSSEVVLFTGRMVGRSLLAINTAGRVDWHFSSLKKFSLLTEAGYSSGTSVSDRQNGDLKTVPFSRDYDVSLLVFEEALPGGKTLRSSTGVPDNLPTAPHSGAVSNALYGRVKFGYEVASFFHPAVNVIFPYAAKEADSGGRFYGVEYDLLTQWPINHYFSAELDFAHFIPGSYYNNVSKEHSVLLFRGGVTAQF